MNETKSTRYLAPFLSMVVLFLIVGFLTTANTQFQGPLKATFLAHTGNLKNTLATLITFSWFLAYPVCGKMGARLVNSVGYKKTLFYALVVMLVGLLLFFLSSWITVRCPAARLTVLSEASIPWGFLIFLAGSFVVGGSVTILQVVINPYLSACDVRGTQPVQRLAIGGTANALGTTLAPYFVSGVVFGGLQMNVIEVRQLQLPFLGLAAVVGMLTLALWHFTLPDIRGLHTEKGEHLERSVWSFVQLRYGVVAIFFYVGCEVCIGGNINLYVLQDKGLPLDTATLMATLYWGGILTGRLVGSLLSRVTPRKQLVANTSVALTLVTVAVLTDNAWLLVAVGLCHSIMWGAIYTLAVDRLGKYTSVASGVFMIGVLGGAVLPLLQGMLADSLGAWRWSWSVVLLGEVVMLLYGIAAPRFSNRLSGHSENPE